MSLQEASAQLSTLGIKHVVVSADLNVRNVWYKIAKIFGYKPSIKIIEDEARGGHRLRVAIDKDVIEYGIWKNGIQVVAGMINSDCVKSVVDSAVKKIKAEYELHESIRENLNKLNRK